MTCNYCTDIDFETDYPMDRDKLILEGESVSTRGPYGLFVNNGELLLLEYHQGFYIVKQREDINFCPMCGKELRKEVKNEEGNCY